MRRDDLISVMESFKGISENPMGSNRTQIGVEFGWNGVPWCAETISVACSRLGFPLKEASVARVEQCAKEGFRGMKWTRTPTLASAVVFDFGGRNRPGDGHTGLVVDLTGGGRFYTVEGNYHDRCAQVLRDMTYVRGFATFPFDSASPPPPPAPLPPPPAPLPVPPQKETDRVIVNAPQVCILYHSDWDGYLQVTSDGGVFQNGHPPFYGSLGNIQLNAPIVDADVTPTGKGYMMLSADGGIFDFGDAAEQFEGGLAQTPLNAPCTSFRFTKSGKGYWIAAKDGGVFSFGDAEFRGTAIEYRG